MTRPGVGVVAVVAAAGAVVWAVHDGVAPQPPPATTRVCAAVEDVIRALDLTSLGDQAALPARAAELADLLRRSEPPADVDAAGVMIAVLADGDATVQDLAEALEPVADRCSVELPGE